MHPTKIIPAIALVALAWAGPLYAQGDIPSEVIAECNAAGKASDLPECLKEGAIAFEMFDLMREDRFYGDDAAPIIENCTERNETLNTAWLCFKNAATTAAETRELIGPDNISDGCVAAVSDGDLAEEIQRIYSDKRDARFPGEMFFGGDMFYPFQGCAPEEEATEPEAVDETSTPDSTDGAAKIAQARCDAYGELETAISEHSADELRDMHAALTEQQDGDAADLANILGISAEAAKEFENGGEAEGMQAAALTGAFLRKHHPPLLEQILEDPSQVSESRAAQMGGAMATGIIMMMLDSAEETYRAQCGAT